MNEPLRMSSKQTQPDLKTPPAWLHVWAMVTVCATLPLLFLGAEVTSKQVGMVDSVGFREPWHLFVVWERAVHELGYLIEHSHRSVGFLAGMCIIGLAVALWRREPRRWVRWLGLAALAGVCIQGLLGGFRVNLNAIMGRNLALVHGCFAQLVFTTLVSLAVVTSRSWVTALRLEDSGDSASLRHWSIATAALVYLQIIFGAFVRHKDAFLGARAHMLAAFAVVAAVVWLIKLLLDQPHRDGALVRSAGLLAGLLAFQLFLGVESWISRFGSTQWQQVHPLAVGADLLRSLHYLVGTFLFATAVTVALRAHRQVVWAASPATVPVAHLEGVA
jgi:heme a synthase